jgi:RNA ligase
MKLGIQSVNTESFYVNEHIVFGEQMYLITPKQIDVSWDKDNLHLRSSLWSHDGELVSASYFKFFNYGEKPELSPLPKNLNGATIVAKIDGSTIIISKYKGNFIIRSRGTVNAYTLTTGAEMDILKAKYPKLFEMDGHLDTWNYSVITEYVSPANQIVIKYDEVDFILTGVVFHNDYSLMTQDALNHLAKALDMPRPEIFTFDTLENLLANVEKWEGKEGVVLYCKDGQQLLKIKAAKYLFLHRMKSELSSLEKIVDVWVAQGCPSYQEFYNYILTTFDYELAEFCKGHISNICDGYKEVLKIIAHMKEFVQPLKSLPRKDAALKILGAYGGEGNNRSGFVFQILDGKDLLSNKDAIKKLIFQSFKK